MTIAATEDPFDRSSVVHTRDVEEMRHAMLSVYGASAFEAAAGGEFEARASFLRLGGIGVGFCGYDARASASFGESDFARVQFALRSSATTWIGPEAFGVDQSQVCITTPGRTSKIVFEPGLRQLILRVDKITLDNALTALLGARPRRTIAFHPAAPADHQRSLMMRELAMFVGRQFSSATPMPSLLRRELVSYAAVSFLMSYRNNFSEVLEQDGAAAAAHHVRRAEDYIEAHWNEPITVEQLAALTNVSVRSLYLAFERSRGYSPKAFVKMVRLRKARDTLRDPGADTVTATALAHGFHNLGHFARDYRLMFGETPSQTLAHARRHLEAGDRND